MARSVSSGGIELMRDAVAQAFDVAPSSVLVNVSPGSVIVNVEILLPVTYDEQTISSFVQTVVQTVDYTTLSSSHVVSYTPAPVSQQRNMTSITVIATSATFGLISLGALACIIRVPRRTDHANTRDIPVAG